MGLKLLSYGGRLPSDGLSKGRFVMDWVGVRRTCCLFVMLVICNYFYNEEHFANIECHNWRQSLAEIDIILQGFLALSLTIFGLSLMLLVFIHRRIFV